MSNIIQAFPKGNGGGHTILDTDGAAVEQEKKLQFTGLDVSDDSTNEKTEVKAVGLNTDSLNDIIQSASVQGNAVASNGLVYSTTEQIVGRWIDGKPLYHKVITVNGNFSTMDAEVTDVSSLNIEELVDLRTLDHSHFGSAKFAIIPFSHPEGDWAMAVYINDNNKICVCPGKYMSLVNPTFILQYTKTTD